MCVTTFGIKQNNITSHITLTLLTLAHAGLQRLLVRLRPCRNGLHIRIWMVLSDILQERRQLK